MPQQEQPGKHRVVLRRALTWLFNFLVQLHSGATPLTTETLRAPEAPGGSERHRTAVACEATAASLTKLTSLSHRTEIANQSISGRKSRFANRPLGLLQTQRLQGAAYNRGRRDTAPGRCTPGPTAPCDRRPVASRLFLCDAALRCGLAEEPCRIGNRLLSSRSKPVCLFRVARRHRC